MSGAPTDAEKALILNLVGSEFNEIDLVKDQLNSITVEYLNSRLSIQFHAIKQSKFKNTSYVLGEESHRDLYGMSIAITIFQRDGYLWRLEIEKADGSRIRKSFEDSDVKCLGYNRGLSLETRDHTDF